MGSACLFFSLAPGNSLLADINQELVDTFVAVKDMPLRVADELQQIPLGRDSYYSLRALNPRHLPIHSRAARFIFLNRFCFNGLYRTNLQGQFNVPFAGHKTGSLPSAETLLRVSRQLAGATLVCSDFEEVLQQTVIGDFVYLDPPYATSGKRAFSSFQNETFNTGDISRLGAGLRRMNDRGVRFLVSYSDCPEAHEEFGEWNIEEVVVQRNIAGFSKHRRKATELLIYN